MGHLQADSQLLFPPVCGSSEVCACVLGSTSAAFRSERIGVLLSGIWVKVLYNCKKTAFFVFFFFTG